MQRPTAKHWVKPGEPFSREGRRIEDREVEDTAGTQSTESTTQSSQWLRDRSDNRGPCMCLSWVNKTFKSVYLPFLVLTNSKFGYNSSVCFIFKILLNYTYYEFCFKKPYLTLGVTAVSPCSGFGCVHGSLLTCFLFCLCLGISTLSL